MDTQTATETKVSTWAIDTTHSEFTFKVKHMMISTVTGQFEKFDAKIEAENDDFKNAKATVEVDIHSISTKAEQRNGHLKSDDFFNAKKFPKAIFKSTAFDGNKVAGDLTIRDITKPVTLDVDFNGVIKDPYGLQRAGFEITGEISRKDFGLKWNELTEAGGAIVSDKVKLYINAEFVKQ